MFYYGLYKKDIVTSDDHAYLIYVSTEKLLERSLEACEKVQVGKDQEKAHSEKDSESKNRCGEKLN